MPAQKPIPEHERALIYRAFACAEEDSNLHPVSLDQALNLVTRPSTSRQIVRIVQPRTKRTHRTIWMLPRMLPGPASGVAMRRRAAPN
jgi:hypothetical protein